MPVLSRRAAFAAPLAVAMAATPAPAEAVPAYFADRGLMILLADTRAAEDDYHLADTLEGEEAAADRLWAAVEAMVNTEAESLMGVACKAYRICRSLRNGDPTAEGLPGPDAELVTSLWDDLRRLHPELRA